MNYERIEREIAQLEGLHPIEPSNIILVCEAGAKSLRLLLDVARAAEPFTNGMGKEEISLSHALTALKEHCDD